MKEYVFLLDNNDPESVRYCGALRKIVERRYVGFHQIPVSPGETYEFPESSTLVAAGRNGVQLLKQYSTSLNEAMFITESYRFEDLSEIVAERLMVVAPPCVIDCYHMEGWGRNSYIRPMDLFPCFSAEEMRKYSSEFQKCNQALFAAQPQLNDIVSRRVVFFGGWVEDPSRGYPNHCKENTDEQFKRTAQLIMEDAGHSDLCVIFDPERSCKYSDGELNMWPQKAAIAMMEDMRWGDQRLAIFANLNDCVWAHVVLGDGNYDYKVNNPDAVRYYALEQAVKSGAPIQFTAEQLKLVHEAMTLGAKRYDLLPIGSKDGWRLVTPENEEILQTIFSKLREGKEVYTLERWF